ncbi:hypothetical protein ES288_D02G102300v1 [Gossypium darwinii]|uniref:Uncharacterized protein n=2 Tax=Gossypium TaxID=3633 RepID=A0A5D2LVH3_GOSTO|nr:hypothetical protein ES288_D02G102300v1 [Gossypium darwinii]TYH83062.1 hypothetical protein ES332_D02G106500v1 [Gossypium tomentosum]
MKICINTKHRLSPNLADSATNRFTQSLTTIIEVTCTIKIFIFFTYLFFLLSLLFFFMFFSFLNKPLLSPISLPSMAFPEHQTRRWISQGCPLIPISLAPTFLLPET